MNLHHSTTPALGSPGLQGLKLRDFCRILRGRLLLWVLPAVLLTVIYMQVSAFAGRLSIPPTYDDVVYFNDGLSRLLTWERDGFSAFYSGWQSDQPHSPLSTLQALAGFAVFGPTSWAPYATNIVFVLLALLLFDFLTWGLSWWKRAILFVLLMASPLLANVVVEFRPDLPSSLLLAGGIILVLHGDFFWQPRWFQALGGALLGLALWAKPAAFAALIGTVVGLFGLVLILEWILRYKQTSRWRILAGFFFGFGAFAVIGLPYVLLNVAEYIAYMKNAFYGADKPIPNFQGPFWENMRMYWDGAPATHMVGSQTISCCFLLFIVSLIYLLIRGPRQAVFKYLAYFCVLAVLFAGPTSMPVKTNFFGSNFEILTLLLAIGVLAGAMRRLPLVGTFVAGIFAWYLFFNTSSSLYSAAPSARYDYINDGTDKLVESSIKFTTRDRTCRLLMTAMDWLNGTTLAFKFLQQGYPRVKDTTLFMQGSVDSYTRLLGESDLVIASEPQNPIPIESGPCFPVKEETLALVRAREEYSPIGHVLLNNGKGYYLFWNRGPYFGFLWGDFTFIGVNLPGLPSAVYAARGNGDSVLLAYAHPEDFHLNVDLRLMTKLAGQKIHVSLNGAEIGICEPVAPGQSYDYVFDLPPAQVLPGVSRNCINFTYDKAEIDQSPGPVPQVYYQEIQIRPVAAGLRGAARGGLAACRPDWISRQ